MSTATLQMYGHIWSYMATYSHIWSHIVTYGHVWSHMATATNFVGGRPTFPHTKAPGRVESSMRLCAARQYLGVCLGIGIGIGASRGHGRTRFLG